MSDQNNNRRYTVFSQNPPQNKQDLWLSYNRHLDDDDNEQVDSQDQRNCDLVLKAWDCGAWIPVVGFNTVATNKISTVQDNVQNHLALFTGSNSSNQLMDSGYNFGDMLSNTSFVSATQWANVFENNQYDWDNILGDIIQSAISTSSIPQATTSAFGGIKADIVSTSSSDALKLAQVRFYPSVVSSNLQGRLCVEGHEIMDIIDDIYNQEGRTSLYAWNGLNIQRMNNEPYIGIVGVDNQANIGRFARVNNQAQGIEWVSINASSETNANSGKNVKLARITIGGNNVDIYGLADTSGVQNGGVVVYDENTQKLVYNNGSEENVDVSAMLENTYCTKSYVDQKFIDIAENEGIEIDLTSYALASAVVQDVKVVSGHANQFKVTKNGVDSTITINNVNNAVNADKATKDSSGNNISSTYAKVSQLSSVATSGNYSDLSNRPTKLSDFTNDSKFISVQYDTVSKSGSSVSVDTSDSGKMYTIDSRSVTSVTLTKSSTGDSRVMVVVDNNVSSATEKNLTVPSGYKVIGTSTIDQLEQYRGNNSIVFTLPSSNSFVVVVENDFVRIDAYTLIS